MIALAHWKGYQPERFTLAERDRLYERLGILLMKHQAAMLLHDEVSARDIEVQIEKASEGWVEGEPT